jgi:hypothetical protein
MDALVDLDDLGAFDALGLGHPEGTNTATRNVATVAQLVDTSAWLVTLWALHFLVSELMTVPA